jgi:aryl-alcohol dehydrogenase-like predicted oxidoreductase
LIERVELTPGYSVSRLINGGWQLSAGHHSEGFDRQTVLRGLEELVDAGLTTFDCADIYTGVEELLGELRGRLDRRGPDAPEIQVHTKYVPDLSVLATVSRRDVEHAVDRSLRRLGVEVLDLVQFAWWDYAESRYVEVVSWLDEQRQAGKIRHLGTTNFDAPRLGEICKAGISIAANQPQYSLLDRRPEGAMVELCRRWGIQLLCYGTVAGGFMSGRWVGQPEPAEPLANRSLVKYKLIIDEFGGWRLFQELLAALAVIARKHRVSPTNVATRWVLERPRVASVLVGTRSAAHLEDNLRVFELRLDQEDRDRLDEILQRAPGPTGEPFGLERLPDGPHAVIMKTDLNRQAEN